MLVELQARRVLMHWGLTTFICIVINFESVLLVNYYLFPISAVPLCSLESRAPALRKHDISQMELLESRTTSANAGYRRFGG